MKAKPFCAVVGCTSVADDKHHIGGFGSPMIWICKACHGRIHGVAWNSDHERLTREGLAKAKAAGRIGGNPKLRSHDPEMIAKITAIKRERAKAKLLAGVNRWLPTVRRMRPLHTWAETAGVISGETKEAWSTERLRRSVKRLVELGQIDADVMKQAPPKPNANISHHLVPLIKALAPGRTLASIAAELERMGERTPRGGLRWHASSVMNLLKRE